MAEGTISIGSTTLDTPAGYIHEAVKHETFERTIRGNLIINRAVSVEDQPISKYRFEISDVVNSKAYAIKAEAAHVSGLYLVDYLQIVEVLSGDGATLTFYTQREMNSKTSPVPTITVGGVAKTPTITINDSGRAKLVFAEAPADIDDNIIIQYEPKYAVRIISYKHTYRIKDVAYYTLICEEV